MEIKPKDDKKESVCCYLNVYERGDKEINKRRRKVSGVLENAADGTIKNDREKGEEERPVDVDVEASEELIDAIYSDDEEETVGDFCE